MPQAKITRAQYDTGLDAICDKYEGRSDFGIPENAAREHAALETFKASVEIIETAPPRQGARHVTETAPPRRPGKAVRRAARLGRQVAESLASAAPAKPARPAAEQLAGLSHDDLAGVAVLSVAETSASPFWRSRETAPAARITESAAPAPEPPKPLHEMTESELAGYAGAQYAAYGAAAGLRSPIWAA